MDRQIYKMDSQREILFVRSKPTDNLYGILNYKCPDYTVTAYIAKDWTVKYRLKPIISHGDKKYAVLNNLINLSHSLNDDKKYDGVRSLTDIIYDFDKALGEYSANEYDISNTFGEHITMVRSSEDDNLNIICQKVKSSDKVSVDLQMKSLTGLNEDKMKVCIGAKYVNGKFDIGVIVRLVDAE